MGDPQFARNTSSRTGAEWAKGLGVLLFGLVVAHLGVSLFLLSGLGSDPFTTLIQGISIAVGLSIGTVHVMALIAMTALMLIFTRGYVKPGTAVCAVAGGWIIDFFLWAIGARIGAASPLIARLIAMAAGVLVLSFGMSIVIASNSGTGPNDLVAMILSDRVNRRRRVSFRWVRMGCDLAFAGLGFALGGTLGVGTLVAVLLTGPAVQFFLPISRRGIARLFPAL